MSRLIVVISVLILLTACGEGQQVQVPPPAELTRDAVGYYCGMIVVDHPGPKGQIFVKGQEEPLWFSSVRDTIAFTMLPEETAEIRAIYVNDMAQASDWASPESGIWINAREAYYVIGSSRRGGMGALEAVPFSSQAAAEDFVRDYGGRVVRFGEIPDDYILGDAESLLHDDHAVEFAPSVPFIQSV